MASMRWVWVDGFSIRNTLDDDFGIAHRSSVGVGWFSPKFYIPSGEWWIDGRYQDEANFLISVEELSERQAKKRVGMGAFIDQERSYLKPLCASGTPPEFVVRREEREGLRLVFVEGTVVRHYLDPEFVLGGHDRVYSYIPAGEVWLDVRMDPREVPYIILHETVERDLMGQNKNYDVAHEYATTADKEARRLDGVGRYPGDADYPWRGLSNEDIFKHYVIQQP